MTQPILFKVLTKDCEPTRGGTFKYPLPADGEPGEWMKAVKPVACKSGYHLTSRPASWWVAGARLFTAEARGAMDFQAPDKVACESIRLLEEVTPEWPWLPLFPEIKALLVASWRARNLTAKEYPDWAHLSGADRKSVV